MYFLEYADAAILRENLEALFEGESTGGSDYDRYWYRRDESSSSQEASFGVQGTVHIVNDIRLNALLISTASQNFELIDDLIKKLDVNLPDQEWGTRFFYLKHADAEHVANLINTHYKGDENGFSGGDSYSYYRGYLPQRQSTPQAQGSLSGKVAAQPFCKS